MTGTRINYVLAFSVCSVVLLMIGCGQQEVSKPVTPSSAAPPTPAATQPASAKVAADVCVVSGEPLDAMGEPVVYNHEGREVKFCCNGCIKKFKADPAKYLAMLDSATPVEQEAHDHSGHNH
jgi:YHS domain-containing protein